MATDIKKYTKPAGTLNIMPLDDTVPAGQYPSELYAEITVAVDFNARLYLLQTLPTHRTYCEFDEYVRVWFDMNECFVDDTTDVGLYKCVATIVPNQYEGVNGTEYDYEVEIGPVQLIAMHTVENDNGPINTPDGG